MSGKYIKKSILLVAFIGLAINFITSALADTSDTLYWAADPEGTPPYPCFDATQPNNIIGFEVDFAKLLAETLGRPMQLKKHDWDTIIPGLDRHLYDMVINGIVISSQKEDCVSFSKPYYITAAQLLVQKSEKNIQSLNDLSGKVLGIFKSPEIFAILRDYPDIQTRNYENEVYAFSDLAKGRIDAVLVDEIAATYAVAMNPSLTKMGSPIGHMEYAVVLKKEDTLLLEQINSAIDELISSGKLRQVYEEWNIWNQATADYFNDHTYSTTLPIKYRAVVEGFQDSQSVSNSIKKRVHRYISFMPLLMQSAWATLKISIVAMLFAMLVGFILAIGRVYGPLPIRVCVISFIELIRGTPLMIQLLFIYYGLSNIGINLSPFLAGVLGLGINYAAFEAENYRAGILAVPKGQLEAARALGMTHFQGLFHIVFPQAFTTVIPPITNDFISLLKDSSLVSIITIVELSKTYTTLAFTYYDFFGIGILVAIIYLVIGLPFVRFARWAEKKLDTERKRYNRIRVRPT